MHAYKLKDLHEHDQPILSCGLVQIVQMQQMHLCLNTDVRAVILALFYEQLVAGEKIQHTEYLCLFDDGRQQ